MVHTISFQLLEISYFGQWNMKSSTRIFQDWFCVYTKGGHYRWCPSPHNNVVQLLWTGHVIRMSNTHLTKQILYSLLKEGQQAPRQAKETFHGQYQNQSEEIPHIIKQLGAHCTGQALLEEIGAGRSCMSWNRTTARRERKKLKHQQPPPLTPAHTASNYVDHGLASTAIWKPQVDDPKGRTVILAATDCLWCVFHVPRAQSTSAINQLITSPSSLLCTHLSTIYSSTQQYFNPSFPPSPRQTVFSATVVVHASGLSSFRVFLWVHSPCCSWSLRLTAFSSMSQDPLPACLPRHSPVCLPPSASASHNFLSTQPHFPVVLQ